MTAPAVQVLMQLAPSNLLSPDDASFEGSLGTWAAQLGSSIAQSTAQALDGTHSMAVTRGVGLSVGGAVSQSYLAAPNTTYAFSAAFRAAATPRSCYILIQFVDINNAITGTFTSPTVTDTTTGWVTAQLTCTAPPGTYATDFWLNITTSTQNEVHYIDEVGMWAASTVPAWSLTFPTVDVSAYVSGQIQIQRGRSREVDQFQTGSLSFTLRNEDRRFDPSNTASPYYPYVVPRGWVQVSVAGVQVFGGYVDDLQVDYEIPNICVTNVTAYDGFNILSTSYLQAWSASAQTADARIKAILTQVGYPTTPTRVIDASQVNIQANTFSADALSTAQAIATSEQGLLFCDRTGALTFRSRYYTEGLTSQATFSDVAGDLSGGAIGYQQIQQMSQALLLFNQVVGTRSGGTQQSYSNVASQAQYRLRSLQVPTVENATDADVLGLCQLLIGRYDQPEVRFASIGIELQSLTAGQRTTALSLELGQLVTVKRTPPGSGTPATISILSQVEGVSLSLDVSNSSYMLTLALGSVDERSFLKLDDSVFGTIDSVNMLGY